jgi:predicted Zn-dependent protease
MADCVCFCCYNILIFKTRLKLTGTGNNKMKKVQLLILSLVSLSLLIISCSTVPLTGRSQLNLISDGEMLAMSYQQYDEFLKQNPTSKDQPAVEMVQRVGVNIQHAVETYMVDNFLSAHLQGYKWEFNLVESDQVNAWCMPGGKVVIYTGMTGLAVVMGHEIAHAIAEHGNERMSQQLLQQAGAVALMVAMKDEPAQTQALWLGVYGVGSQVAVMLPYSRTHESEADHMGLIFMAMAGYNPNAAPEFWERMAVGKDGEPLEFLSTHPSSQTRINNLKSWIPEAMRYYKK